MSFLIGIKGQAIDSLVGNLCRSPKSTSDFTGGVSQVFRSAAATPATGIEVDSEDAASDDFGFSLWTVESGLPRGNEPIPPVRPASRAERWSSPLLPTPGPAGRSATSPS